MTLHQGTCGFSRASTRRAQAARDVGAVGVGGRGSPAKAVKPGEITSPDQREDSRGTVRSRQRADVPRELLHAEVATQFHGTRDSHGDCDRPVAGVHRVSLGHR
jgi:hypothetical protein